MRCVRSSLLVAMFVASAAPVRADDSWAGKTIIVKKKDLRFGHTDPKTKEQIYFGTLTQMDYVVREDMAGFVLLRQGNKEGWVPKADVVLLEGAIEYFTGAIRMNPQDDSAFAHRAGAHKKKGDLAAAINDFDEAIRLNPQIPAWWSNRGNARFDKKDYVTAIKNFDEAIRLDPKYANAYNDRGNCYSAMKEYVKSLDDLDTAILLAPSNPAPANDKAWLLATCPDAKIRNGAKAVELAKSA